jgi:TP901 family phage tail tape measure protein
MTGKGKVSVLLALENKLQKGMGNAKAYLKQNVADMQSKLDGLASKVGSSFSNAGSILGKFAGTATVALAVITALAAGYSKAGQMAEEFDGQMRKANVTLQESSGDLKQTSGKVLGIAGNSKVKGATQQAPDAFNILVSSGMDKALALDTLKPTLEAAKAGFTDVAVVAKAAASTINSSGIQDATKVYDILFATLNKGNAEFQDIAQYLPKIIPGAKDAGFELQQVAGAFAFLTAQGQTAEASTTGLMNVFKSLKDNDIINGTNTKLGLKGLGIDIFDATGKTKSLVEIMTMLQGKVNGLTNEQRVRFFDQIGFDMEASTAIASMTQNMEKLKDTIDFTTNSGGQLGKAIEAAGSPMDSWVQMGNMTDETFIKVGQTVNETVGRLGEWLAPIAENILPKIGNLFSGIWTFVSKVGEMLFAVPKAIIEWANKSELVSDIFKGIEWVVKGVYDIIVWVVDKITWLYDHTLKPILDAVDWLYTKIKGGLGFETKADAPAKTQAQIDGEKAMAATDAKYYADAQQKYDDKTTKIKGEKTFAMLNKKQAFKTPAKKESTRQASGITGGQQTRYITINGLNLINGDFISKNPEFAQMNQQQLEQWLAGLFNRMMIGLGRSAS